MKKRLFFWLLVLLVPGFGFAQYRLMPEDSLQQLLSHGYASPSPTRNAIGLALLAGMTPQTADFDSLKNILVAETESSRDRSEMCRVNLGVAQIYLRTPSFEQALHARPFIEKAEGIAEESGLDLYKAGALLRWATFYIAATQLQKALNSDNQALAIALATGNDSLISVSYSSLSYTYDYLDSKLARFQSLLSARSYADRSKITPLRLRSLLDLASFYQDADQMEKCRDLYAEVVKLATKEKAWDFVIDARRGVGTSYRQQHEKELAVSSFDSALSLANKYALKKEKISVTIDLLNYYFNEETPDKGLAYLTSNPDLGDFIKKRGLDYQLNKLYAIRCEKKANYDSALYYLKVAAPSELIQPQNFAEKMEFSEIWAEILTKSGRKQEALEHLLMAQKYADSSGDSSLK